MDQRGTEDWGNEPLPDMEWPLEVDLVWRLSCTYDGYELWRVVCKVFPGWA